MNAQVQGFPTFHVSDRIRLQNSVLVRHCHAEVRPNVKSYFHPYQTLPAYPHPEATALYLHILLSLRGDFVLVLPVMKYDGYPCLNLKIILKGLQGNYKNKQKR